MTIRQAPAILGLDILLPLFHEDPMVLSGHPLRIQPGRRPTGILPPDPQESFAPATGPSRDDPQLRTSAPLGLPIPTAGIALYLALRLLDERRNLEGGKQEEWDFEILTPTRI